MKAWHVIAALCCVGVGIILFLPNAQAACTQNDATCVNPTTWLPTNCNSGGTLSSILVTAGINYTAVGSSAGTSGGGTQIWSRIVTNASELLFQVNRDGTLTNVMAGTNPVLVRHVNVSASPFEFYWAVNFTMPVTVGNAVRHSAHDDGALTIGCATAWDNAGKPSENAMTGYIGTFLDQVIQTTHEGFLFNNTPTPPPGASTLSGSTQCVASPFTNVLTWTSAANVTGYNLTRVNLDGSHTVFALGNVLTYTDSALVTNQTYSVHGWGAGGNASESNSVTLQCPHQNLGQALIGGDSGQTLSQGYFGSPSYGSTAKIVWGVLAVLTLGLALGMTVHPILGYGGAVVGIIACFAFGWFPLWILLFLIVVGGGATLVWANYGRNQE